MAIFQVNSGSIFNSLVSAQSLSGLVSVFFLSFSVVQTIFPIAKKIRLTGQSIFERLELLHNKILEIVEGRILDNAAVLSVRGVCEALRPFQNPSTFLVEFRLLCSSAQCGLFILGRQESAQPLVNRGSV